jgi:hypothetical protein
MKSVLLGFMLKFFYRTKIGTKGELEILRVRMEQVISRVDDAPVPDGDGKLPPLFWKS